MSKAAEDTKAPTSVAHKLGVVIGTVLCVLLTPILVINITLIIRSFTAPDEVPSVGGIFPLIVLTDSMYPQIQSGDLIICRTEAPENIREGDVIAFLTQRETGPAS